MSDTLTPETIARRVRWIVATTLNIPTADVVDDAHLVETLGASMNGLIAIARTVNREWDLEVLDQDLDRNKTTGDWIAYVVRQTIHPAPSAQEGT